MLGFEFAFTMAVVVSLASLDLGVALVTHLREARVPPTARAAHPGQLVGRLWWRAALASLALLAAPLAVICLNAIRVRNCDFGFGFRSFAALPVVTAVIASGLGVFFGLLLAGRRILARAVPYLVVLVAAMWSVWRFYAAPPVFSYNIFAGYFPGNLYDEAIDVGATLFWSRLYHLAVVGALLSAGAIALDVPRAALQLRGNRRPQLTRWRPIALFIATAALAVTLKAKSGELGFSLDSNDIEEELGERFETENFIIIYRGGSRIGEDIELIAEDHEFRLAQLVRTLGVKPARKIKSFYFASANEKARLMGAKRVYMAKPWRSEIYLNHAPFPHQVVRHEIAHVVAGEFGDPIFGVSAKTLLGVPVRFNVGLIEGLAVAADWPDHFSRPLTPHQSVKALSELGMEPRLEGLLSTGFLSVSSARSYTTSGSFVYYLLENYGAKKLRALYESGGDFASAYGQSFAELAKAWRAMIGAIELAPGSAEVVRERFRRRSIFQRKCPHAVARARERVAEHAGRGRMSKAIAEMRSVCDDVPGEPTYLLELARLLVRDENWKEADEIYATLADDSESISSEIRARAILARAELAAAADKWPRALTLIREAVGLPVTDATKRLAAVQEIAGTDPSDSGAALRRYFFGDRPGTPGDPVAAVARAASALAIDPNNALAHYLVGFNLRSRRAVGDAASALGKALDLGLPHPLLRREAARLLAETAYAAGDYAAVLRAADVLSEPSQPEVLRLYAADWRERVEWKRTGSLPASP